MTRFFSLCFCSTAESDRTPVLLQSVQCKYCHISEWSVPAVCVGDRKRDRGAISQSSPSKALRMFCQSRFLFSFLLLYKFLESLPSHDPPFLPLSLPPSRRLDKIVPLLLPRPLCGGRLLDWLDWLPSHLIPGAQYSPATRGADFRSSQFTNRTSVWERNLLLIQSFLHFDCFLFKALPFLRTASCCRILRNSLENLHNHFNTHK